MPRLLKPAELLDTAGGQLVDITETAQMSDYEKARLQRIRENNERMKQLGLLEAAKEVQHSIVTEQNAQNASSRRGPPAPKRRKVVPASPMVTRVTRRSASQLQDSTNISDQAASTDDPEPQEAHLTQEEYFKLNDIDYADAYVSDGVFRGWVAPHIREKYAIAENAAEAWESGGGGKFDRKINKKDLPSHLKAKGWSDAKCAAATMLHKNPNQYFYRMVAPGVQQATGEWSEEEHEVFMKTLKEYGCGDKWGLFASYVGTRVGYQCSSYYKHVILARGFVLDKRYKMTRSGEVIWVG